MAVLKTPPTTTTKKPQNKPNQNKQTPQPWSTLGFVQFWGDDSYWSVIFACLQRMNTVERLQQSFNVWYQHW